VAHSPYATVPLFTYIDAPVYYFLPGKLSFSHGNMPRPCISGRGRGISGHRSSTRLRRSRVWRADLYTS